MFPYLALISLVAFAGGIQNSHASFSLPAFTPILFNLCLIIAALLIAPKYDMPIFVLAWGVLLAGFLQLLIQFFPLFKLNRLPIPKLNFKNSGLKKFFVLILPAIFAGGIIQINLLVDTIFASLLETGSPTWLYVSDRLIQFPMGIFAIAIGTVLLPTLSKIDLKENKQNFIDSLQKAQTFVLFIGLPSLIGLFFCAEDLISTIFLRGEFKIIDVYKSSYSLMAFSLGLPFFMLMKVLTPAFFARKDTKTPMYVALLALFSNAILNYVLAFVFGYGHVGIAIGSSIATLISVLILELILIRDGLIKISKVLSRFNVAILTASIALIAFLKFFSNSVDFITLSQGSRIFYLLIEVAIAISIYFVLTRLIYGKNLKKIFN
jgi:putative peptidoglycan lipid II flippase